VVYSGLCLAGEMATFFDKEALVSPWGGHLHKRFTRDGSLSWCLWHGVVCPQRKKAYKKSIDQDDARRRREETQIQIRKNKREESLNQRRRTGA
jgi:hypothetical protein